MGASLIVVLSLAGTAKIKVPRLESGGAVGDFDRALAIAAVVTNVAEPFYGAAGLVTQSFVDDLSVGTVRPLVAYDREVLLWKIEGLYDAVSPG